MTQWIWETTVGGRTRYEINEILPMKRSFSYYVTTAEMTLSSLSENLKLRMPFSFGLVLWWKYFSLGWITENMIKNPDYILVWGGQPGISFRNPSVWGGKTKHEGEVRGWINRKPRTERSDSTFVYDLLYSEEGWYELLKVGKMLLTVTRRLINRWVWNRDIY